MSHIYKHHTHTSHALGGAVPLSINLNKCKGRVPENPSHHSKHQTGGKMPTLGHAFKKMGKDLSGKHKH